MKIRRLSLQTGPLISGSGHRRARRRAAAVRRVLLCHHHRRFLRRRPADRPSEAPTEVRNSVGMEFVRIPAGEFRMGSASPEALSWREQPVTQVRISRSFDLGKYEVTQGQRATVMRGNPSFFDACGLDCPVEQVSWEDAQEFIRRLNAMDGAGTYRLPTETEWEYAARAGTTGDRYAANLGAIAWYHENSGDRTHPVGGKAANAFGLHDMLGNVLEWAQKTRSSDRNFDIPGIRPYSLGFRLLRTE